MGRIDKLVGESPRPNTVVPPGIVFGGPISVIPRESISGQHQHVKFNITLTNYTICMAGQHALKLSSGGGAWFISFSDSDFGFGSRISKTFHHGDSVEYVCASNHPSECHHQQGHADICSFPGGMGVDQLKLHSDLGLWTLQDLIIFDQHLNNTEIAQVMDFMWSRTKLKPCSVPKGVHGGRRLSTGLHSEPMVTLAEIEQEDTMRLLHRNGYIFNQTSHQTFATSAAGITIIVACSTIFTLVSLRVLIRQVSRPKARMGTQLSLTENKYFSDHNQYQKVS